MQKRPRESDKNAARCGIFVKKSGKAGSGSPPSRACLKGLGFDALKVKQYMNTIIMMMMMMMMIVILIIIIIIMMTIITINDHK